MTPPSRTANFEEREGHHQEVEGGSLIILHNSRNSFRDISLLKTSVARSMGEMAAAQWRWRWPGGLCLLCLLYKIAAIVHPSICRHLGMKSCDAHASEDCCSRFQLPTRRTDSPLRRKCDRRHWNINNLELYVGLSFVFSHHFWDQKNDQRAELIFTTSSSSSSSLHEKCTESRCCIAAVPVVRHVQAAITGRLI